MIVVVLIVVVVAVVVVVHRRRGGAVRLKQDNVGSLFGPGKQAGCSPPLTCPVGVCVFLAH